MINGIPPSDKKAARQTEADKPDASSVPRDASEQFSSLLHKKNKSELKELAKSKKKIEKSIAKVTDRLTQQMTRNQEPRQQPPASNQSGEPSRTKVTDKLTRQIARNQETRQQPPASKQSGEPSRTKVTDKLTRQIARNQETRQQPPASKQSGEPSRTKVTDKLTRQIARNQETRQQPPASKQSGEPSRTKVTDKLTRQIARNQETRQQPPASKQSGEPSQQASKAQPSADKQQANDNENLPQSLDAFDIASMIARNQAPAQSGIAPTEAAPAPAADLNQVVGEIADRILVSSAADNPNGVQEIRIHLKESVLPDTEVRIYRHAGSLQVEFMTASKDSEMFIAQRQAEIQKTLGERLSDETVTVSVQDSRQTQSGQEQGRSRQQYIRPDQDDNE